MKRPDWAWDTYNAWRKRAPAATGVNFEFAGWWHNDDGSWSRQNDNRDRITVHENGAVVLTQGHLGWT